MLNTLAYAESQCRRDYLSMAFARMCCIAASGPSTAFANMCTMTASGPSATPPKPAPRRRRRPAQPRRARRASDDSGPTLAQKYRASANLPEESVLVGGDSVRAQGHRQFSRSSRFPSTWAEAVCQMTVAVSLAYREGYERLLVDLRSPELVARDDSGPPVRLRLLMDACNATLGSLMMNRDNFLAANPDAMRSGRGNRAAIYFNTRREADVGIPLISPRLRQSVDAYVLGEGKEAAASECNIAILLCPRNTDGNPSHIEHVEMVHYSNWNHQNLVLILNPSLIALTRHGSLDEEPRPPSFLSDYHPSYYIDPVAHICKNATGAMLRCFPRKWEMYLLRARSEGGFRLIAEQNNRPSREKVKCEFSWRADLSSDRTIG